MTIEMTEKLVESRSRAYMHVFVCVHVQDLVVSYLATFWTSVVYTIAIFATCIHYVPSRNKNASEFRNFEKCPEPFCYNFVVAAKKIMLPGLHNLSMKDHA